jgi:tagatose-6-phosphate ketose/aldose isomerase
MLSLGYEPSVLAAANGQWTAREIAQQPACLEATQVGVAAQSAELEQFLAPILADRSARIVLTGAGSSDFIGQVLAPILSAALPCRVEAIATTDIVSAPALHLDPAAPTLLVSFGRSGDSPESVAAVALADQCLSNVRHLVISCNANGALAHRALAGDASHLVLLPEPTHDRGFAMTSSFTAMMLAGLSGLGGIDRMQARIGTLAGMVESVLTDHCLTARQLAAEGFSRVVYLGSGPFKGLAAEAALKLLELSNGRIVAIGETPLGFRHGPKTIVDPDSLVIVFLSNEPYTRRYELDLLAEIRGDGRARRVMAVSGRPDPVLGEDDVVVRGGDKARDAELAFPYVAFAQMLAFHTSLELGLTPDNPNPEGLVNRVVKGVTIHPFAEEGGSR